MTKAEEKKIAAVAKAYARVWLARQAERQQAGSQKFHNRFKTH